MPGAAEGTSSSGAGPDACGSAHPGTIAVRLLSLSGAPVQLEALSLDATVRDLALQVRARLEMPISVQHLILGTSTLADPSASLRDVFGQAPSAEVTVVRRPFTPEDSGRAKLHTQLVRAVAAGQAQQFRELLLEGAQVNFRAEGHGAETPPCRWRTGARRRRRRPRRQRPRARRARRAAPTAPGAAGQRTSATATPTASRCPRTPRRTPRPPWRPRAGASLPVPAAPRPRHRRGRPGAGAGPAAVGRAGARHGHEERGLADRVRPHGHPDFVDIVKHLAAGADVNARLSRRQGIVDTSEGAPLHACAAQFRRPGAFEVAQILVRKGAGHELRRLGGRQSGGARQVFWRH
ncbi:unnamed protein product [Prorocentrum cordatum]|uniref:Ubiquitin-like domain-containing protein n=1 Tax=Prorocentrum cordatum TaxID=2364126 RepID=A0ABN9PBL0_9DINO|nr:unnamed protein product [Polarella glacialis]